MKMNKTKSLALALALVPVYLVPLAVILHLAPLMQFLSIRQN